MKTKIKIIFSLLLITAVAFAIADFSVVSASNDIEQINSQIKEKQKRVDELKKQSDVYLKNITEKQQDSVSLQNQLAILENKVAKTEIDIKTTDEEMEKTKLEIKDVELQITNREKDIMKKDTELKELIRLVHLSDQQGTLEILLINETLSDFFDQIRYTKSLQGNLQNSLVSVKSFKKQLEGKKDTLNKKSQELQKLKDKGGLKSLFNQLPVQVK